MRTASWFVPAALLVYAGSRWLDGRDVFAGLASLPDPPRAVGPLLFLVGTCWLLGDTARRHGPGGWICFPVLALAAVAAVAVDLSLLPVTAVLFIPALAPSWMRDAAAMAR